jgi:glycosyltransferase involved in cell wall biosynthesis
VLRTADLLILNARVEPFGLVLIEATASGTPVLATEVAGPRDILFDQGMVYGFTTPPPDFSNAQVLAERLVGVAEDPEGRSEMADRAHEMVQRRFSLETFRRSLNSLYH